MKSQVIYFSKSGNTKKIAETIASELDTKAEDVKQAKLQSDGLVFLGSGSYGSEPAKLIKQFISDHDFSKRTMALFGTSGGGIGKEVMKMEELLLSKDAIIKGKFFCKGKFMIFSRGRPNDDDLNQAKQFAKRMMK